MSEEKEMPIIVDGTEIGHFEGTTQELKELLEALHDAKGVEAEDNEE